MASGHKNNSPLSGVIERDYYDIKCPVADTDG